MECKAIKIVVSGDITINSLLWRTYPQFAKGLHWEHYPHVHNELTIGGALLLSKLVALATGTSVLSPQLDDNCGCLSEELIKSTIELGLCPKTSKKNEQNQVYRVEQFLGFTGPTAGLPQLLPIVNDDEKADLVIIDDEDNGFNGNAEFWPLAIKAQGQKPVVIYKMNNPNGESKLWKHLEEAHLDNTIVVINGEDLRSKEVNLSKSLSWEKTALDFVWQLNNNPNLIFLARCRHFVVPFGLEGAIYYRNDGKSESRLYFLTHLFEGDFIKEDQGKMYGLTSCFVAGLAQSIVADMCNCEGISKAIDEGIRAGIVAAQKYFIQGFGTDIEKCPFPHPAIFSEGENDFIYKEHIQDVVVRNSTNPNCHACWYIIKDKSSANLAEIAYDIVKQGEKSALKFIPIAQFGNLKTVDRTEIEGYRSIKNLIQEYVSTQNTVRPLSIAVFGTPGSGKSFGVSEVASSIAPNLIEKLNFNLSQFEKISDLAGAFHRVRDLTLEGKIPLVFFDEFDSFFGGKLGWIKYFLAPMQDAVFRQGDSIHPIGKAIFVFAGGTSSTFAEFCGEDIKNEQEHKHFLREFAGAKGPDFVSRLKGYVNTLGPNQTDEQWDQLFVVRRAMLLRSLLERKVPHLINGRGEAQIDNGVLRALLKVARYKHESRSMEAIMDMSRLTNAKKWEQSMLPSKEQLKLHVDEEHFFRHLMHDAFFSEKIDRLAMELYHADAMYNEDTHITDLSYRQPWEDLSQELKDSIRSQIRYIPNALHRINYDVISVREKPEVIQFTEVEMETLAEYEHKRWSLQKKEDGWKYGAEINEAKKTHPLLVPWDSLPSYTKRGIVNNVETWPEILAKANLKIERLRFLCYCETNDLR